MLKELFNCTHRKEQKAIGRKLSEKTSKYFTSVLVPSHGRAKPYAKLIQYGSSMSWNLECQLTKVGEINIIGQMQFSINVFYFCQF